MPARHKVCKLGFIAAVGMTLSSSAWAVPGQFPPGNGDNGNTSGHESQCSGKEVASDSKPCKAQNTKKKDS